MKKIVLGCLVAFPFLSFSQGALGEVVGKVVLKKDQSVLEGAKVQTTSNGAIYRAMTDENGRFRISAIPAGNYTFSVIFYDDTLDNITGRVPLDGIESLGVIEFYSKKTTLVGEVPVKPSLKIRIRYAEPEVMELSQEDIERRPDKFNVKQMIASSTGGVQLTDDGELVFRGARKGDMIYMLDGIKMNDAVNIPSAAIGSMKVYTGGVPAKYGDTTGGVVVMETLSYFDLYRDWQNKQ